MYTEAQGLTAVSLKHFCFTLRGNLVAVMSGMAAVLILTDGNFLVVPDSSKELKFLARCKSSCGRNGIVLLQYPVYSANQSSTPSAIIVLPRLKQRLHGNQRQARQLSLTVPEGGKFKKSKRFKLFSPYLFFSGS